MAQSSGDFNLPDKILSVMPTDPYVQLDLARKITSRAIASRVTKLEEEAARLRQNLREKDRHVEELENKVSRLETAYQDAELRLKISREDNVKLLNDRDSLSLTVKKLTRDLAKLETFKRQLMQSLNDENSPQQKENLDIGKYDQSVINSYAANDNGSNGCPKYNAYRGSTNTATIKDGVSKPVGQRLCMTTYTTPRLAPTGTPKVMSHSAAVSPQKTSRASSPTTHYARKGSLSSWYPSSQQSSAANSPPRGPLVPGRNPRIDGKEFFRQARSRLSLEQFSAFLTNVKELNAQKQSREETLRKAEEIFGIDNKDLYLSFQGLLNRNVQ